MFSPYALFAQEQVTPSCTGSEERSEHKSKRGRGTALINTSHDSAATVHFEIFSLFLKKGRIEKGVGWLRVAIDWLDAAFPVVNHTRALDGDDDGASGGHQLVNVGTPGGSAAFFAPCMTKWIPRPEEVDVWVLEFQPVMRCEHPQAVERVVRQALGSRDAAEPPPALFFSNFRMWCERDEGDWPNSFNIDAIDALCDPLPHYRMAMVPETTGEFESRQRAQAVSETPTAWRDVRGAFDISSGTDKYLEVLARRYGGASWSVTLNPKP